MALGDLTQNTRPEFHSNERLDLVDTEPMSRQALDLFKVLTKAIFGKPPATVGQPCGLIFKMPTISSVNPFEITLTGTAVGLDADGQHVIKLATPNLVQAGFGVGTSFVYLYRDEAETATESRRFIPAVGPFNETTDSVFTRLSGTPKILVGATGAAPIIQGNTVDGKQVALLCIGSATFNGGGAMTAFTFTENYFSAGLLVADRSTVPFPVSDLDAGSITDFVMYLKGLLSMMADANWGSAATSHTGAVAASRSNNWYGWKPAGAFRPGAPKIGLEETNRLTPGTITVGDGVNTFGNIDSTDFGSTSLLLKHMIEAGGTYELKPGSVFTLTANVVPASGGTVRIIGNGAQIDFASFTFDCTRFAGIVVQDVVFVDNVGAGGFIYPDSALLSSMTYRHCQFFAKNGPIHKSTSTTPANTIFGLTFEDCFFSTSNAGTTDTNNCILLYNVNNILMSRCTFNTSSATGLVFLGLCKNHIQILDCSFTNTLSNSGLDSTARALLTINSDFASEYVDRCVKRCTFTGTSTFAAATGRSRTLGLVVDEALNIDVVDNIFYRTITAITHTLSSAAISVRAMDVTYEGNKISVCDKNGMSLSLRNATTLTGLQIKGNKLRDIKLNSAISVFGPLGGLTLRSLAIQENEFFNINEDTHADFSARTGGAITIILPGALESCSISNNRFSMCANVVINMSVPTTRGVNIKGNTLQNILTAEVLNNPSVNAGSFNVCPMFLYAQATDILSGIVVEDNTIMDLYTTNSSLLGTPTLILLKSNECNNLIVRKNTIIGVADGYSGGANLSGHILTVLGATSSATTLSDVVVEGNTIAPQNVSGATVMRLAFLSLATSGAFMRNIHICNNTLTIKIDGPLSALSGADMITLFGTGGGGWENITVRGNRIIGFSAVVWSSHFFTSTNPLGGISITDNQIFTDIGWDNSIPTSKFGIDFRGQVVFNYIINDNNAVAVAGGVDEAGFYGPFDTNIQGGPAIDGHGATATIVQTYNGTNDRGQSNGASSTSVEHARNRGFSHT